MYSNVAKITNESGDTVYIFEEESRIQWIPCGWYPTFLLILALLVSIFTATNSEFIRFAGQEVKIEGCGSARFHAGNRCALLAEYRALTGCRADISASFGTLTLEFRIFCLEESLPEILISFESIAIIIGFLISGELIGAIGRKTTLISALFISSALCFGVSFFIHLQNIIFTRAIIAGLSGIIANASICFFFESIPSHLRLLLICLLNPSYSLFTSGIAFVSREWRNYLRIAATLALISTIFLKFSVESVFHSLQSGKFKRAKEDLHKIYGVNSQLDEFTSRSIEKIIATEKRHQSTTPKCQTYFHLFFNSRFLLWTFLLILNVLFFSHQPYQMRSLQELFPFDLYLNSISAGIFNWITILLFVISDFSKSISRKDLLMSCQICFALATITSAHGQTYEYFYEISVLLHHLSREMGISLCLLIGSEIFPTGVRSHLIGLLLIVEKFGGVYLNAALQMISSFFSASQLFAGFSLLSPLLIFTALLLPESKNSPIRLHFPERSLQKVANSKVNIFH